MAELGQEARIRLVVDGSGNLKVLDQAGDAVEDLGKKSALAAELQEELRKQLVLLNADLADAQKAFRGLALSEKAAREEAAANIAGMQRQRRELQGQLRVLERTGSEQDKYNRRLGGSNQLLLDFSRLANDSQQFQYGFQQGLVATSNQIDGLAFGFQRLNEQAAASGNTIGRELLNSLKGPSGMIALLNIGATAAILFGDKLAEAFDGAQSKAVAAREELDDILGNILEINRLDLTFNLDENQLRSAIDSVRARIDEIRKPLEEEESAIDIAVGTLGPAGQRALQQAEDSAVRRTLLTAEERVAIENQVEAREALLAKLEAELELSENIKLVNEAIAETDAEREETAEERKRRLQAEREAERERRDLARLTADIEKELEQARLKDIEDARERELQALQNWYEDRVEQAAGNADLLAQIEETRTLRENQINEEYRREALEAEEEFQRRLNELRNQYERATGASEAAVLQAQIARIDRAVAAEEEGTEEYRRLVLEREKLAVRLANVQAQAAERAAREQEQAAQRAAREEQKAYQQRLNRAEQYSRTLIDALDAAIAHENRYTETSLALARRRYEEERQALLDRQALGEDVNLELRALAEERARFERDAAEDTANAVTRSLLSIVEAAKAAAIEYIKAELAKAAARQVTEVIGTVPFPLNIALAGGAALAVFGLESVIRGAAGFASGGFAPAGAGYIGQRGQAGRDSVPIVVGAGEAIVNRHQQRYVDAALVSTYGFDLEELFRRISRPHFFASGGFAGTASPPRMSPAPRAPGLAPARAVGAGVDAGVQRAILAELQRLNDTVPRAVGNPHAARRLRHLADRQDALTSPRGGVLSR